MPEVVQVAVSVATETVQVEFDRMLVGPRDLVERIEETGFDAMLQITMMLLKFELTRTKEIQEWRSRFLWALAFAAPVFFINFLGWLRHKLFQEIYLDQLLVLFITVLAQFWLGDKFYKNAYRDP